MMMMMIIIIIIIIVIIIIVIIIIMPDNNYLVTIKSISNRSTLPLPQERKKRYFFGSR